MWTETPVFREDLERLASCSFIPWGELKGKTVLITGATGLIGYTLASSLLYYSKVYGAGIQVIALVRELERAREKFRGQLADQCSLTFVQGSVENLPEIPGNIDYIVHGASPTASTFFVERPVETIMTTVLGTHNVLELARKKQVSGFVYLSSMEVYGEITNKKKLRETDLGRLNLYTPRSSYPEAKRMAETLCFSYKSEYNLPTLVARLAQTFGPGVDKNDKRIFAYLTRKALNREVIYLSTSGLKENMYLYTTDAASAILLLMIKGVSGSVYNVGNPETYCSIKEMAQLVVEELSGEKIAIVTNIKESKDSIYPPDTYLKLDIEKLTAVGWTSEISLRQMYQRMAAIFRDQEK